MLDVLRDGGPRLGVQIRDLEKDELAKLKLTSLNGVAVVEVTKDSAAERAGVKANDVIVQFDGENVRSTQQLTRLVRETVLGRTVKMAVMRDGKRIEVDVTPAVAPARSTYSSTATTSAETSNARCRRCGTSCGVPLRAARPGAPASTERPAPPGITPRYHQWALPPGAEETLRWFSDEFPGPSTAGSRPAAAASASACRS